jgi:hypothetical protein
MKPVVREEWLRKKNKTNKIYNCTIIDDDKVGRVF